MLPAKTSVSGTPTNASARIGFGQLWDFVNEMHQAAEIDVASAATVDMGGQLSSKLNITGTAAISSFGTNYRGPIFLRFSGAMKITYNATTLVTARGQDLLTQAGDTCVIYPKSSVSGTANGWVVADYQRYNAVVLAYQNFTPIGNVTTGVTNLMVHTVPANYFSTPNAAIRIRAGGSVANNGNAKTLTWIGLINFTTSAAAYWELEAIMSRAGVNSQKFWSRFHQHAVASKVSTCWSSTPVAVTGTNTETSPYVIQLQGQGGATNDIIQTFMTVEYLSH